MAELLTFDYFAAFVTLTIMEIVLGVDNLVFISIAVNKLRPADQPRARMIGLGLAMGARVVLLLGIVWIMQLVTPILPHTLFEEGALLHGNHTLEKFSWKDLILFLGGGYLVYNAVKEIHHKMEADHERLHQGKPVEAAFNVVIMQIIMMDLIFSLDSVITAVGMVEPQEGHTWQPLAIMIAAVMIAVVVMMIFANPIGEFINRHPSTKMLALAFLLLIGTMLVAEAFHHAIPKGYIYSAMAFSIFVEVLNLWSAKKKPGGGHDPDGAGVTADTPDNEGGGEAAAVADGEAS